jgi:DNA helicase-2/ATP-dependent DNA helicase PcrA
VTVPFPAADPIEVPQEIRSALGGASPTAEQWAAISMPLEPYVVVAGAGSGKTSVVAARIVYLALAALGRLPAERPGVLPGDVLCLTFTNKATENLQVRVRRALRALDLFEGEEPTVVNYHSFAAQILERHGLLGGVEPQQRILTAAQRVELCGRVLNDMSFSRVTATWQPTLVGSILELADQMANHRVRPGRVIDFNERRLEQLRGYRGEKAANAAMGRIELARAVQRFHELKRELGVIDFGDQITLALDIVERFPEVSREYRERFQAVVLDEYQDTNVAQAQLIHGVFGGGFPVTAVGDPDQNIYAWRGASLFNLIAFQDQFRRADGSQAERLSLYTNFRSGSRILAAADRVVQALPASQRPDSDKTLVPWAPNGEGAVELLRVQDEQSEADAIAERVLASHEGGIPWHEIAVLCRKSRLFEPLQRAFAERGVPAEFVGLAGLLKLPEVIEVLAYVRAVADPFASVSLARILMSPRYRVGFKDLARVAAWAKDRNYELRDRGRDLTDEDEGEATPFLFAEALEHLDEVTFLSEEGRDRLDEFRAELKALRDEARRPVGEFLAEIIRRIGLLTELDASVDVRRAAATRRNLAAFLDQVHAFSPLDRELTLRSFMDYVDAVEMVDRSDEWAPVQPSEDDSVKVMTIHQAKGLEFDVVIVPGMARGILPDTQVQQNPAERPKSLDFELRGDAAILPRFEGNLSAFYWALRAQALVDERRTCYVALTRARRSLVVTGAHWYGDDTGRVKHPSEFFEELADWGAETGLATVERGDEPAEANPLFGYRERFVTDWPGPALRHEGDDLFPGGWRQVAVEGSRDPGVPARVAATLSPEERSAYQEGSRQLRLVAEGLLERERRPGRGRPVPSPVSVSGVAEYLGCPKRFYWSSVRPLPRFSGPAARLGTQIHTWIERRGTGQATLIEFDEEPDLTAEDLAGSPGKLERLQDAFLRSRFGRSVPLYAERPFLLSVGAYGVGGRIDAVFGTLDGPWEVVDYKSGRVPTDDDALTRLQLDVYALACVDVFGKRPEDLMLTYFYLATEDERSWAAGDPDATRERLRTALDGMAAGRFEPVPGERCTWCDFTSFCQAGRAYLATRKGPGGDGPPPRAGSEEVVG